MENINVGIVKLDELSKVIHDIAKSKGFWDKPSETGTLLMLVTSELSEALEADRKGKYADMQRFSEDSVYMKGSFVNSFEECIKDTFEDELADSLIRILDIAASRNIDIQEHVLLKLKSNKTLQTWKKVLKPKNKSHWS